MSNSKLYVGNLSFKTTEDELRSAFGQFGSVTDVYVAMDKMTGRPRGFAFVTMGTADEAKVAAEKMNGVDLGVTRPSMKPSKEERGWQLRRRRSWLRRRGGGNFGSSGGHDRGEAPVLSNALQSHGFSGTRLLRSLVLFFVIEGRAARRAVTILRWPPHPQSGERFTAQLHAFQISQSFRSVLAAQAAGYTNPPHSAARDSRRARRRRLIGSAQAGAGKTAAFALPI